MFSQKTFQLATLCLATLGFGVAGTPAEAGSCSSSRGHYTDYGANKHNSHTRHHYSNRGHSGRSHYSHRGSSTRVHISYGNSRGHVSVGYNNGGHYRGHTSYRRSSCDTPTYHHVQHQPSGYWKRVYVQPVYAIRYMACGTPYRVCIRAGYWTKVWVDYRY